MNINIFNETLDSMIKEAAKRADTELGEQAENTEENIEFSNKHERKMKKLFARACRQEKLVKIGKHSRRVACVLIALAVVAGVSLFEIKNAMHIGFGITDSAQTFRNDYIIIRYLPENFQVRHDSSDDLYTLIVFENQQDDIKIGKFPLNMSITIDTENSEVEDIKIHSNPGKYIDNPRFECVIWKTDEWIYHVLSTLDRAEIIRIAESIT